MNSLYPVVSVCEQFISQCVVYIQWFQCVNSLYPHEQFISSGFMCEQFISWFQCVNSLYPVVSVCEQFISSGLVCEQFISSGFSV